MSRRQGTVSTEHSIPHQLQAGSLEGSGMQDRHQSLPPPATLAEWTRQACSASSAWVITSHIQRPWVLINRCRAVLWRFQATAGACSPCAARRRRQLAPKRHCWLLPAAGGRAGYQLRDAADGWGPWVSLACALSSVSGALFACSRVGEPRAQTGRRAAPALPRSPVFAGLPLLPSGKGLPPPNTPTPSASPHCLAFHQALVVL